MLLNCKETEEAANTMGENIDKLQSIGLISTDIKNSRNSATAKQPSLEMGKGNIHFFKR